MAFVSDADSARSRCRQSRFSYVILENFNQVGFPDSLEIPIGILAGELSTCDNTVRRARQELFNNGYIFYESGRQKRSAIYQLIDLDPRYFSVKMEEQVI